MDEKTLKSKLTQWLGIKREADVLQKAIHEKAPGYRSDQGISEAGKMTRYAHNAQAAGAGRTSHENPEKAAANFTGAAKEEHKRVLFALKSSKKPNLTRSESMQKADSVLGNTRSGKPVMAQAHPAAYKGFTREDHSDAKDMHYNAANATQNPQIKQHHMNRTKQHMQFGSRHEQFGVYDNRKKAHTTFVKTEGQPAAVNEPTIVQNPAILDHPNEIQSPNVLNAYKEKK